MPRKGVSLTPDPAPRIVSFHLDLPPKCGFPSVAATFVCWAQAFDELHVDDYNFALVHHVIILEEDLEIGEHDTGQAERFHDRRGMKR